LEKATQISIKQTPYNLNELYDKYAGMLLGYLFEIVKDIKLAEYHLVNIYNILPQHLNDMNTDDCNIWCQLQRLAKKQLSGVFDAAKADDELSEEELNVYYARNRFIALMSYEQKQVFCNVYYRGKTTAQLSIQLNRQESNIRKALKEAFTIIKTK